MNLNTGEVTMVWEGAVGHSDADANGRYAGLWAEGTYMQFCPRSPEGYPVQSSPIGSRMANAANGACAGAYGNIPLAQERLCAGAYGSIPFVQERLCGDTYGNIPLAQERLCGDAYRNIPLATHPAYEPNVRHFYRTIRYPPRLRANTWSQLFNLTIVSLPFFVVHLHGVR